MTSFFEEINNGANTRKMTTANLNKSPCMIHLKTLLPLMLHLKEKLLQMHMQQK